MEWAFSDPATVKRDVDDIILNALSALRPAHSYKDIRGETIPIIAEIPSEPATAPEQEAHKFTTITFADSIAAYGSDKPDLRIPSRVRLSYFRVSSPSQR